MDALACLHSPSPIFVALAEQVAGSQMTRFIAHVARVTERSFSDHQAFHRFSVREPALFWGLLLEWLELDVAGEQIPVLVGEFASAKRIDHTDLTGTELTRHLASRTYFNKRIVDAANLKGLKPVYWDEGWAGKDGFALFDRNTAAVIDPDGVRSLTGGAAVPPPL